VLNITADFIDLPLPTGQGTIKRFSWSCESHGLERATDQTDGIM